MAAQPCMCVWGGCQLTRLLSTHPEAAVRNHMLGPLVSSCKTQCNP